MLLALRLRGYSVAGCRRTRCGWTVDLLIYRVIEGDAFFVGNLISGMAGCATDMMLPAGSDDIVRVWKTNFVDGRCGALFKAIVLIPLPGCLWSQLYCSLSGVEALCIVQPCSTRSGDVGSGEQIDSSRMQFA